MAVPVLISKHLLILCCYGGSPFVDLWMPGESAVKHKSTFVIDPTDWIATDIPGSELNSSIHPEVAAAEPNLYIPEGVLLKECDLFNLTFTNVDDERLYDAYKGSVKCRCPSSRKGNACELSTRQTVSSTTGSKALSIATILIAFLIFTSLLITVMRCGFCDCFGPFRSPFKKDDLDAPLDENTVNRCLELVRAHEARENLKIGEHSRPLIATVSEGCSPYNTTVEPPPPRNPLYRRHSPPPSYRSERGSLDQLQNLAVTTDNTRL